MDGTGGLARIEIDDDGRVCDVLLDPRAGHLPLDALRAELISAFSSLHVVDVPPAAADQQRLAAASAEITEIADRRFAEISTALYDISRRAANPW